MTYDFSIIGVLKESLNRADGVKGKFIGALIIFVILTLLTNSILEFVFPSIESKLNPFIASFISGIITVPVHVGVMMLGVSRAREENFEIADMFNYFVMAMPIVITYIFTTLMLYLGFILLILPGIYLSVAYAFSYMLIVDKGLGTWEAMELSRKTVTKQWFKFFGLSLLIGLTILVSIIPLGIGLIWTLPMAYITYGLLYHHLFDDEEVIIELKND